MEVCFSFILLLLSDQQWKETGHLSVGPGRAARFANMALVALLIIEKAIGTFATSFGLLLIEATLDSIQLFLDSTGNCFVTCTL